MIQFDHVSKTYLGGTKAVEDFSLEIRAHTCTVLVGSSGSGKTTLMRMINRMVDPTSGRVLIGDDDVAGLDPVKLRRKIGYVMQAGGLLPHRTVVDNIATVPILNGESRAKARGRALELLDVVGLERSLATRYPAQLSGGQQQRVGVARGLASDPKILLMDEPFGAVDPIVRAELQAEMARIQRDLAKTIVFVTHDVDEAFLLGDQVVILSPGGVVEQQGSPAEIVAHPANDFVRSFVGSDTGLRALTVRQVEGRNVVVDGSGRPLGVLGEPGQQGILTPPSGDRISADGYPAHKGQRS